MPFISPKDPVVHLDGLTGMEKKPSIKPSYGLMAYGL